MKAVLQVTGFILSALVVCRAQGNGTGNLTTPCGVGASQVLLIDRVVHCRCETEGYELVEATNTTMDFCRRLCNQTSSQCARGHVCRELTTNHSACVCAEGYYLAGNGDCLDIDECLLANDTCAEDKQCVNTPGDFKCSCLDDATNCTDDAQECGVGAFSFIVSGVRQCACADDTFELINARETTKSFCRRLCNQTSSECASGHVCWELTTNHSACVCAEGYYLAGNGDCLDIDECLLANDTCAEDKQCVNTPGDFKCNCLDDATNCTDDAQECGVEAFSSLVSGVTKCACEDDNFELVNATETTKSFCRQQCNISDPSCPEYQECVTLSTNHSACICADGYELDQDGRCIDIDECKLKNNACLEDRTCINSLGSFECKCIDGAGNCGGDVTEPAQPAKPRDPADGPPYALIGGVVGGAILLLLIILVIYCSCRKSKKRRKEKLRQSSKIAKTNQVENGVTGSDDNTHNASSSNEHHVTFSDKENEIEASEETRVSDLYSNKNIRKEESE